MNSIFTYSDYREYLADYYSWRKEVEPGFSHRVFLRRAGMTGPNFLKNIIDRKVNLSTTGIPKFIKALGISGNEAKYFEALVMFNQAKTVKRRQEWFEKLSTFSDVSPVAKITRQQLEYLEKWYTVAIREYIHTGQWNGDYDALGEALHPKISAVKARNAVQKLETLGLIQCVEGTWEVTDAQLSTGSDVQDLAAAKYHSAMSEIAKNAITTFARHERYFRGLTASFSEDTYGKIREEIIEFAQKVTALIGQDEGDRKVYQLNMQLFPLFPPAPQRRRKKKGEK